MKKGIKFLTLHGIVTAHPGDCVSLTFWFCKTTIPYKPVTVGVCKSITTMCDHDIGVVIEYEEG